ncbi:hypothetical protein OM076_11060 [Solirubrobacter ginsenosidimutans]|uniref:Uncharacterized protein n=1 Tax=Solirubrobacter ginsenosidimutans TaxID=490573 RepID=A0A9X3MQJ6_9ACTN|nr:hypothetical protein [Solirubrobacter ginsenosidimutans]MDA0160804.1 hypothetical protein [Solirubrobacter ginsenosidimutans]
MQAESGNAPSSRSGPETGATLRRLLDLADELQASRDFAMRRLGLTRAAEAGVVAGLVVALVVVWTLLDGQSPWYAWLSSATIAYAAGFALYFVERFIVRSWRMQIRRERYVLREAIATLRETESVLINQVQWSALERAEYQMRLSRHDP